MWKNETARAVVGREVLDSWRWTKVSPRGLRLRGGPLLYHYRRWMDRTAAPETGLYTRQNGLEPVWQSRFLPGPRITQLRWAPDWLTDGGPRESTSRGVTLSRAPGDHQSTGHRCLFAQSPILSSLHELCYVTLLGDLLQNGVVQGVHTVQTRFLKRNTEDNLL